MTLRSLLFLALVVAGCSPSSGSEEYSRGLGGTTAFASEDPLTDPTPAFAIYTSGRHCIENYQGNAFAFWCSPLSPLFSWDDEGRIRDDAGLCLSAQSRQFDSDGNVTSISDLIPWDENGTRFYPCDGEPDQQWSYTAGQIWMPLPSGDDGIACLEFHQQSPGSGSVFTDVADDLDDCIIGYQWKLADRPPNGGPQPHTCQVELIVQNEWEGGFVADLVVTYNDSIPTDSWTMDWTFGSVAPQITSLWNAGSWSQAGDQVIVTDAGWNGPLSNFDTVTIGFVANGTVPSPEFLDFHLDERDCLAVGNGELDGAPAFPIWTDESDPSCLVAGPDNDVDLGDCADALEFRWLNGALQVPFGRCLQDTSNGPQLWPCDSGISQSWARDGEGALFTGNGALGFSCLTDMDKDLTTSPGDSLDGCSAWNQGGPPNGGLPICSAEVVAVNSWPGGFVGEATFIWNGTALESWLAQWEFDNDEVAVAFWNGAGWQVGSSVSVWNESYNGDLDTGDSVTIGFVAEGELGTPFEFMMNGNVCESP